MIARILLTALWMVFLQLNLNATTVSQAGIQYRPVAAFSNINVRGSLDVDLHTGYRQSQVILHGDTRDLENVNIKVIQDKLYVSLGAGYPHHGRVVVEVRTRYLDSFDYRGVGTIRAKRLTSPSLEAVIDNPGRTDLRGHIVLRRLVVAGGGEVTIATISSPHLAIKISGNTRLQLAGTAHLASLDVDCGRISLYWVKSRALTIRGRGDTFIQLAGFVDILDVKLWGMARFNGRYLRANRVFAKTYGTSVAEISALRHQHILASDSSDIRFYHLPQTKADFMAFNGAALDMRDLRLPAVQEYDEYNK